ncbi:MAG: DUF4148 domain-containing protein [bacterium]|nr:DUF4148 domain-containing protein [bacterium]
MKSIIVILALAMALTSAVVFAEEAADEAGTEEEVTATNIKEVVPECFVDVDGDEVCDNCAKTAEECVLLNFESGCEDCGTCGDKTEE